MPLLIIRDYPEDPQQSVCVSDYTLIYHVSSRYVSKEPGVLDLLLAGG